MKKILFCIAFILLAAMPSWAQSGSYNVKVQLVDKTSGEPVPYATVSLTPEGSDKVDKYAQSDENGKVTVTGVKAGKYKLQGILLGYDNYETKVEVNKNIDLGVQKMKVSVNFLQSATVTEVGNPIIVKKDTIEHNVSLMKSNDNDVLEDLLKRLPGIEVSSDGSITANGKTISKIQIDGKQFFMDDPSLASKNLPAKIIDKVRVVEKKSEQAEFTGIDDGEEETVLDLGIKKGMMNGWFGNIMGGGGYDVQGTDATNDLRYQGAAMVANFTESKQLAFIGNANNTNNRGFNDMAASAMGGMRGGGMRGGQGGGGMNGNGISSSYMAGFHGGNTWDDKSELIGDAMFNGNEKYVKESTAKTTYKEDGSQLFATDDGTSYTNTYGVRAGARADWKASKSTSFIFEPNFNIGWGNFEEKSDFATQSTSAAGLVSNVNDGYSYSSGDSKNQEANGRILWRQRLGKAGRTISINARYAFTNKTLDGVNQSLTNTYDDNGELLDPTVVNQNYQTLNRSQSANARLSYTEPLGKNFYAELNYRFNYSQSTSTKETYERDDQGRSTTRVEDYCSDISNFVYRHNAGFNIRKQEEKYNISLGASFQPQTTVNERKSGTDVDTTLTLKVFNWSPNARVDINFSDYRMLRFNYRGNTEQPSLTQMMPVPDNSNPQRVTLGNLALNPSFSHDVMIMYRNTNKETFSSLNANVDFSYNTRGIVNASWYDDNGVQYTVPLNNDDGSYSGRAFIMYNTPIAKSKFSIMSFTMLNASNGISYVGKDGCIDISDPASYTDPDNYTKNGNTTVGANETLRLTYRDDIFEVSAGAGVRYSQAWYTITSNNKAATWNNNVEGRFLANIPNILNISTDARYTFYKGYESGYNDPTLVWNAELSRQIFKNQFTISLKAYDILNQSKNTYRTTQDNYVLDTRNNTLGRYVMLSLTWRFGTFGGKKGQRGQMGGPGGGPMGPPPGGGPGMRGRL